MTSQVKPGDRLAAGHSVRRRS
uniref:50S ribosomal protein L21 n=1 Tax=Macrostomum lignano TaxID=282301 RepID=A0A1I8JP57_9PLAT